MQRAVRALKADNPELLVFTDVCLCEYMSHGHCGIVQGDEILNDPTLDLLARTAVSHAAAGADIVAPSDMMDGRVAALRRALDAEGFADTPILLTPPSTPAPFTVPSVRPPTAPPIRRPPLLSDGPANRREALKEVALDIAEGADMVMVKPALAFLDIIREVRELTSAAGGLQCVGGVRDGESRRRPGLAGRARVGLEILTGIRRAGADMILTYHAKDAARWLRKVCRAWCPAPTSAG